MGPRGKTKHNLHLSRQFFCNSFSFSFIIISLKIAALYFDTSLETLRPLSCHCTLQSPGGSLPLPSRILSLGYPGCNDAFGTPYPPKQPTVFSPGGWGLDFPRANPRRWQRPERSSATTSESSWLLGRNWVLLEESFLTTEEGHVKLFHNSL